MVPKKVIYTLIFFLVVFFLIFLLAMIGLFRDYSLLPIGISMKAENWIVIVLSIAGIIKSVHDIYIIEVT